MIEAHPMESKRNAELIADIICTQAYDYVNNDGDSTDFFDKVRYLVHKYDEELRAWASSDKKETEKNARTTQSV